MRELLVRGRERHNRNIALVLIMAMLLCLVQSPVEVKADGELTVTLNFVARDENGDTYTDSNIPDGNVSSVQGVIDNNSGSEDYGVGEFDVSQLYEGEYGRYGKWVDFSELVRYIDFNDAELLESLTSAGYYNPAAGTLILPFSGLSSTIGFKFSDAFCNAGINTEINVPVIYVPDALIKINYKNMIKDGQTTEASITYPGIRSGSVDGQYSFDIYLPNNDELNDGIARYWETDSTFLKQLNSNHWTEAVGNAYPNRLGSYLTGVSLSAVELSSFPTETINGYDISYATVDLYPQYDKLTIIYYDHVNGSQGAISEELIPAEHYERTENPRKANVFEYKLRDEFVNANVNGIILDGWQVQNLDSSEWIYDHTDRAYISGSSIDSGKVIFIDIPWDEQTGMTRSDIVLAPEYHDKELKLNFHDAYINGQHYDVYTQYYAGKAAQDGSDAVYFEIPWITSDKKYGYWYSQPVNQGELSFYDVTSIDSHWKLDGEYDRYGLQEGDYTITTSNIENSRFTEANQNGVLGITLDIYRLYEKLSVGFANISESAPEPIKEDIDPTGYSSFREYYYFTVPMAEGLNQGDSAEEGEVLLGWKAPNELLSLANAIITGTGISGEEINATAGSIFATGSSVYCSIPLEKVGQRDRPALREVTFLPATGAATSSSSNPSVPQFRFKFVAYTEEGREGTQQAPVVLATIDGGPSSLQNNDPTTAYIEVPTAGIPSERNGRYIYNMWFDGMKDYVKTDVTGGYDAPDYMINGMQGKLDYQINGQIENVIWFRIDLNSSALSGATEPIEIEVPVTYVTIVKAVLNFENSGSYTGDHTILGIVGNSNGNPSARFDIALPSGNDIGVANENYLAGWKFASRTLLVNASPSGINNTLVGSYYVPESEVLGSLATREINFTNTTGFNLTQISTPNNPYIENIGNYVFHDYVAPIIASCVSVSFEGLNNLTYYAPSSTGTTNGQKYGVFNQIVIPSGHNGLTVPDGYEFAGWKLPSELFNASGEAKIGTISLNLSSTVTSDSILSDGSSLSLWLPIVNDQLSPIDFLVKPVFRNTTDNSLLIGVQSGSGSGSSGELTSSVGIATSGWINMTAGQRGTVVAGRWSIDGWEFVVTGTMEFYATETKRYTFELHSN